MNRFYFPLWVDKLIPAVVGGIAFMGVYVFGLIFYGGAPAALDVGYMPDQPVPYSHALHVGKLKMDCRYCHNTVDKAAFAAIPPTKTCTNCHSAADQNNQVALTAIHSNSPALLPIRESAATGLPVPWVKVHDLPDYVYFNHSAHVTRGVSCVSCHGRVDQMEVVWQVKDLSMSWCLDCHRNPAPNLRPLDKVTQLDWVAPEDPAVLGAELQEKWNINPPTDCSTCHR
ncbi:Quinol:cytochrome c oxidoreductase pentaheme cytochrome subunit [Planctomycetales bacterium 10988]|nr:Quinol:cytochrome c oxidoreductase pentaheme cytochrome subunit [Planctomycetales bacterium 10988]